MHQFIDQLDEGILHLRKRLKELNAWPPAGDEYLSLMPVSTWQAPAIIERDAEWLTAVVHAAKQGVDIGASFPSFFQKLLTNAKLRQRFLEELDTPQ